MRTSHLDELLSRWHEHQACGEYVSIAELCRDCPDLIPEVAGRLETLQREGVAVESEFRIPFLAGLLPESSSSEEVECTIVPRDTVASYHILDELGRGGMGVVYKARQTKLGRMVALKMVLSGAHADSLRLQRFRTEAEAIARLQHPNIVQIHEVGEERGLPFFSLEYCAGGSLAKRLRGTPMPPDAAAALIETLARAMHVAHEKGIIHRDLKPANVLLTEDGTPKITDFGLARKLDEVSETVTGEVMGTPSYMPPEQAAGKIKELGPACDIYALGAILYECLTGRPPFRAATPLETVQQVIDDEPVPPTQLQRHTPRDLETICLKCLQKDRRRRYPTAQHLADDLRRFLKHEAITARPVSAAERMIRMCRRRPLVAGLIVGLAAVLAVGIPWLVSLTVLAENRRLDAEEKRRTAEAAEVLALQEKDNAENAQKQAEEASALARRQEQVARSEAAKAREFSDLLLGVFESADPIGMQGYTFTSAQVGSSQLTAREILNRAVAKVQELKGHPEIQATQLTSIGNVYRSLGLYPQAGKLLEQAYALRQKAHGAEHVDTADSLYYLGWLYHEQGQYPRARQCYEDALRIRTNLLGADSPKVTATLFNLAWLTALTGDHARSEGLFLDVIDRRQKQHGTTRHRDMAVAKTGLALLYLESGQIQKVTAPCREALAIFRELSDKDKLAEAVALFLTGNIFASARQHALAATWLQKSRTLAASELGDNHPYVGIISYQLADVLLADNRVAEAEKHYRDCVKIARTTVGMGHPKVVHLAAALGGLLNRKGGFDEAVALFDEVLKAHQERFGPDHPLTADVLVPYASLLGTRGALERMKTLHQAVAIYEAGEKKYGMRAISFKQALHELSSACRQAGSASAGFQAALTRKRIFPNDPAELYDTGCELARLMPLAGKDAGLDAAGRKQLADQCSLTAIDTLAQAVSAGFSDPLRLVLEPRLRPLNTEPRLAALMQKLPPLDRGKLQIHHGELTRQDPFDTRCAQARCKSYQVRMDAGKTYQLDLLSVDFDAFLRVENATGRERAFDDDSGGDLNARLVFTPAESGEYRVIVTTFLANQTGSYVLGIQQKN
jgi:tetratricopeptide (TPR) repeat protein/tRNA A-37 threonylcarbamoyl transferase component Bud32